MASGKFNKRFDEHYKNPEVKNTTMITQDTTPTFPESNAEHDVDIRDVVCNRLKAEFIKVYGGPNDKLNHPVGVVQLPNESVVVCDTFNNRLVHYSADGSTNEVIKGSPAMHKPSAAVVLPYSEDDDPQDVSFAVKDHNCIYIFDGHCQQLRVLGARRLKRPYGLSVDDDGYLVTVETDNSSNPCITKIDPNSGEMTRIKFDLQGDVKRGATLSMPRFIACHSSDVLIVVDLGLDFIAMVSMADGSVIKKFGRKGAEPGLFRDPSGVVCDADGFIIIGDSRNHRIQVFSPEGEFLSILQIDKPLKRPSGLCLTACGHLLVANYWDNNVVKYQLKV